MMQNGYNTETSQGVVHDIKRQKIPTVLAILIVV